jgi:hypothetical protein
MNERGLGPATSRQLWRLNRDGLLALRKEPGTPLANRQVAAVIAELVDREQRARSGACCNHEAGGAESPGRAA